MNDTPTDRYFPATLETKRSSGNDTVARALAAAAVLLIVVAYVWSYKQEVDDVDRARAQCVREQRDLRAELEAWEEVAAFGPSVERQINRLASVLRRDCNERYPAPGLL